MLTTRAKHMLKDTDEQSSPFLIAIAGVRPPSPAAHDNVVAANLLACSAPAEKVAGKVFNAATDSRISLNQTFAILKDLTGYRGEAAYSPWRHQEFPLISVFLS